MRPTPFVIVAGMRTGSTLLATTLNDHPEVVCRGELFHPDDLPDNGLPGVDRRALSGSALVRRAFDVPKARAAGFRAMTFLPRSEEVQWADAWRALAAYPGLRAIFLEREDALARYVSLLVAGRTGVYHPSPEDPVVRPENRPRVTVDPDAFVSWRLNEAAVMTRRRDLLGDLPALELTYETLVSRWDESLARVQDFLSVHRLPLPPAKRKQEQRPLSEVVVNWDALVAQGLAPSGR